MINCPRCGTDNADTARFCSNCGNALTEATAPAQLAEVRKTVTVMFMDAVGSTSAGELTDPESLRRVMTRYFDEIHAVVERHGGTVEKYIGDAVMAVFGVPIVHEDDALRAIRAALEIRTRLAAVSDQLRAERGFSMDWRTGINTGEVVAGDAGAGQRFVSGDAVNVAARLEQAAQAGDLLIGPDTFHLVRDVVAAEAAEPVAAKGKATPVPAYRLLGLQNLGGSPASPRIDSPMIGRQRQRRLLQQAYEQAVDDQICHLFTVLGTAGVGKSRLVNEFLTALGDEALVLHGRCLSYGEGITYWPVAEAVRTATGIADEDDDSVLRQKIGALVDSDSNRDVVVARVGQLLGRFGGTAGTEEIFWAVRTLLESLARRTPVVLVLDDIHWAEPTLLDLIENIADWTRDAPLLLLCVARQELLEARPGWGGGKANATTITLEALNDSESRQLIVNLLGQMQLSADLMEKIATAAEGNPLFVEEMIAMLIDTGYLSRGEDGGWSAASDVAQVRVPPSIQALLAARLDSLPGPERAVIERGAVEGKVFHRSAVAELTPVDLRESVPTHLRALSRKELVKPDRSDFAGDEAFRFRHLLIRDAAYTAMPKEARADLHARFARWLERVADDHVSEYEEIVGYHYERAYRYRAELGRVDEPLREYAAAAARHLGSSGVRALRRGDIQSAIKLLRSAAELGDPADVNHSLVVSELGNALVIGADLRGADELLRAAHADALERGDELAAARFEATRIASQTALGGVAIEDVIAQCNRLLEVFDRYQDSFGRERTLFELARQYFFAGRAAQAQQLLKRLLDESPEGEAPPRVAGFITSTAYWGPTPVPEAMLLAHELTARASGRGFEALLLRFTGALSALNGNVDEGTAMIRKAIDIDTELGRTFMAQSAAGHVLGKILTLSGKYEEAERVLVDAYNAMADAGDTAFSSTTAANLADLYIELGRYEEAERFARIGLETSTTDDVESQAHGFSDLARVQAARGEFEDAEMNARRAVEIALSTDYLDSQGTTLSDLGEVLLAAGRHDEAVGAYHEAIQRFEQKQARLYIDRARARLAEIELAEG